MKKILLLGAGGVAANGMYRSLEDHYDVYGKDDSQWSTLMMEANPEPVANPDMIIPIPDSLVDRATADGVTDKYFLPPREQVVLCQDKAKTAEVLGDLAPKMFWVRDTHGAGGKGAQMCSEYLPGRNASVELCYYDNRLIGYFTKERISYSLIKKTTGLEDRGSSVVSVCIQDSLLLNLAEQAIGLIGGGNKHGFYGVDLKQNEQRIWKVTEINAGRLLTASYTYFYMTGYNLALAGVKAFLGEPYTLGKYPEGWGILRQSDQEPRLFDPEITKEWK